MGPCGWCAVRPGMLVGATWPGIQAAAGVTGGGATDAAVVAGGGGTYCVLW